MLGWFPRLIVLMTLIMVVFPYATLVLGLLQWYLCFLPFAIALTLFWTHESKRQKEREAPAPEVLDPHKREEALEYFIKKHKKQN